MKYYVWVEDMCDDVTDNLEEARQWAREFLEDGRYAYVSDADGNEIPIED